MKHTINKDKAGEVPSCVCEGCGSTVSQADALNFWTGIGCLGHPSLTNEIVCAEQHWSCSIPCWDKVSSECVAFNREEIIKAHAQIEDSVHNSFAKDQLNGKA